MFRSHFPVFLGILDGVFNVLTQYQVNGRHRSSARGDLLFSVFSQHVIHCVISYRLPWLTRWHHSTSILNSLRARLTCVLLHGNICWITFIYRAVTHLFFYYTITQSRRVLYRIQSIFKSTNALCIFLSFSLNVPILVTIPGVLRNWFFFLVFFYWFFLTIVLNLSLRRAPMTFSFSYTSAHVSFFSSCLTHFLARSSLFHYETDVY